MENQYKNILKNIPIIIDDHIYSQIKAYIDNKIKSVNEEIVDVIVGRTFIKKGEKKLLSHVENYIKGYSNNGNVLSFKPKLPTDEFDIPEGSNNSYSNGASVYGGKSVQDGAVEGRDNGVTTFGAGSNSEFVDFDCEVDAGTMGFEDEASTFGAGSNSEFVDFDCEVDAGTMGFEAKFHYESEDFVYDLDAGTIAFDSSVDSSEGSIPLPFAGTDKSDDTADDSQSIDDLEDNFSTSPYNGDGTYTLTDYDFCDNITKVDDRVFISGKNCSLTIFDGVSFVLGDPKGQIPNAQNEETKVSYVAGNDNEITLYTGGVIYIQDLRNESPLATIVLEKTRNSKILENKHTHVVFPSSEEVFVVSYSDQSLVSVRDGEKIIALKKDEKYGILLENPSDHKEKNDKNGFSCNISNVGNHEKNWHYGIRADYIPYEILENFIVITFVLFITASRKMLPKQKTNDKS